MEQFFKQEYGFAPVAERIADISSVFQCFEIDKPDAVARFRGPSS
jgi:hypothetical protein